MVTKEQFVNGCVKYIDNEVIPKLPTYAKWLVGSWAVLAVTKVDEIFSNLVDNHAIKVLGVIDANGMIDESKLFLAAKNSATKYGSIVVRIPIVGNLTFGDNDIALLQTYVGVTNDQTGFVTRT